MAFHYVPRAIPANRSVLPVSKPTTRRLPAHPTSGPAVAAEGGVLQDVVLTATLVAILAGCFGLSCLIYYLLATSCQDTIQEPLGDFWYGILP
jgi:hypothetical protein